MIRVENLSKWETAKDGHRYHPSTIVSTNNLEAYKKGLSGYYSFQRIPCKTCIGCRLDYSREWANRGYLEMQMQEKNTCWFITLTYDDAHNHIPDENEINGITTTRNDMEENGVTWNGTLVPKDIETFLDNLRHIMRRKPYKQKGWKYMLCGEYGTETERPHFHLIIFGLKLPTESFYNPKITWKKTISYQNEIIERAWGGSQREYDTKNGYFNPDCKGICDIQEATWENIAYVARYITKKQIGKNSDIKYQLLGQKKEFFRASNRPAIGFKYYEKYKEEIYKADKIKIKTAKKNMYVKPPSYFDKLYERENPAEWKKIQYKRRKEAANEWKIKKIKIDLNEYQQLQVERRTKESKAKTLKRPL